MGDYALGNTSDEARRLMRQAEHLAPHTRRTLEAAGVGPGTRVLDLGAGMADVSLIAAKLGAEVVAVEVDPTTIERARARVAGQPIQVVQGTIPDIEVDGTFDVICGRLILMYLPDPVAALRKLTSRYLKPGGAIAFIEYDMTVGRLLPSTALGKRSLETLCKVFHAAGFSTELGLTLPTLFKDVGFPAPSLDVMLWTGLRDDDVAFDMIPAVLSSLRPIAERIGLAGEIDPDLPTLPARLRAAAREEGVMIGPHVVGAASRKIA